MVSVENNTLLFTPWESVGNFKIDDDITNYQLESPEWELKPDDGLGGKTYRRFDGSYMIDIENDRIRAIFCYDNLTYHDTNLIGLSIDEFKRITNSDYTGEPNIEDFEEDGYPQTVYEFEDIGAQVWEKQGKVVCIIIAGKDSYSDEPYDD